MNVTTGDSYRVSSIINFNIVLVSYHPYLDYDSSFVSYHHTLLLVPTSHRVYHRASVEDLDHQISFDHPIVHNQEEGGHDRRIFHTPEEEVR